MGYSVRSYARGFTPSGYFPPGVKWLLIVTCSLFVLQFVLNQTALEGLFDYFMLVPRAVVKLFFFWQVATYMFLHGGFWHLLFNMLALWMFGADLERTWGTRQFLKFYCFCGVGAGIVVVLAQYLFGDPYRPTIGSSGAIYGVLMAYAVLFPDRTILFAFLFPIQARWFVLIIGAIAFLNTFKSINSPVSDIAHLSGLILAWVYMKMFLARARSRIPKASLVDLARQRYKAWQLERNKKKFQVYLRKHGSDRDWRN